MSRHFSTALPDYVFDPGERDAKAKITGKRSKVCTRLLVIYSRADALWYRDRNLSRAVVVTRQTKGRGESFGACRVVHP